MDSSIKSLQNMMTSAEPSPRTLLTTHTGSYLARRATVNQPTSAESRRKAPPGAEQGKAPCGKGPGTLTHAENATDSRAKQQATAVRTSKFTAICCGPLPSPGFKLERTLGRLGRRTSNCHHNRLRAKLLTQVQSTGSATNASSLTPPATGTRGRQAKGREGGQI